MITDRIKVQEYVLMASNLKNCKVKGCNDDGYYYTGKGFKSCKWCHETENSVFIRKQLILRLQGNVYYAKSIDRYWKKQNEPQT